MIDQIKQLDLTTADGRAEAQRLIAAKRFDDAIKQLHAAAEASEVDAEGLENQFKGLEILSKFQSERPQPLLEEAPALDEIESYQMEFLIDNWMPANRLTIFTGPGGTGKSYLALQHVAALAMGVTGYRVRPHYGSIEDFYNFHQDAFQKKPVNIVVASYEEDLMETWKRLLRVCEWLGWANYDILKERIRFVDLKMFGPIWGVQEDIHLATRSKLLELGEWLFKQTQSFGARLLMLDPSAGAYGGSEISRESVREFCSYLNGWGQETECATLLIAQKPKTDSDYSGSTDWLGSCRALWTLKAEKEIEGAGKTKETFEWYQLTNVKQSYTAPQRAVCLRKIKDETRGGWTPIWEACSQEDALVFYKAYHNPSQPAASKEEDNDDESDLIADAIG